jgi:hypothetical protein
LGVIAVRPGGFGLPPGPGPGHATPDVSPAGVVAAAAAIPHGLLGDYVVNPAFLVPMTASNRRPDRVLPPALNRAIAIKLGIR